MVSMGRSVLPIIKILLLITLSGWLAGDHTAAAAAAAAAAAVVNHHVHALVASQHADRWSSRSMRVLSKIHVSAHAVCQCIVLTAEQKTNKMQSKPMCFHAREIETPRAHYDHSACTFTGSTTLNSKSKSPPDYG
jgi:hypothetical protein